MPRPKGATDKQKRAKFKVPRTPDYYSRIGQIGGCVTRDNHGPDYYRELGRRGGMAKRVGTKNNTLDD